MSSFMCEQCSTEIVELQGVYVTECEHYPFDTALNKLCGGHKATGHKSIGRKLDQGKLRWSLLPLAPVREIIKVLMFGATKYSDNNWMRVAEAKDRYYDALMRHITDFKDGERNDTESGLHHLAHAGCCLLFLLWFELKGETHE